jgi:hypothetical protein
MTFTVPGRTDARSLLPVSALLLGGVLACGNAAPANAAPRPSEENAPPPIPARDDEKWFTSDDGWSFLAPKEFARNTSPGTTGFAVSRPPPPKPRVALVLTVEGFGEDVNAFVAKERAKIEITKEHPSGLGVVVEERWRTGPEEYGMAMVLLAVRDGAGIRLACIASDKDYEEQRPICERAVASLRPIRKAP